MTKQNFVGLVVSQGKMHKTVKVRVQTKTYDKKVHKEVFKRKDYLVHDEGNLCKEGDIVRIESIPKISARKYFAVAEMKVNKGQQFAMYESLAKQKVAEEEKQQLQNFLLKKEQSQAIISQVEDLRKLDQIHQQFQSNPEADKDLLVEEINKIKAKYNIKSWPSTEPILSLELNQDEADMTEVEKRAKSIKTILEKAMGPEHTEFRERVLAEKAKAPVANLKPFTQKNILRKFILDPRNECPVPY
ncbi:37S ribosomal protein S17 mitochondrial [Meyerozyma sp. JA9]|nr:37S ribosomal protein S17 mitochondrial [Meyerozyma sp. JA9]